MISIFSKLADVAIAGPVQRHGFAAKRAEFAVVAGDNAGALYHIGKQAALLDAEADGLLQGEVLFQPWPPANSNRNMPVIGSADRQVRRYRDRRSHRGSRTWCGNRCRGKLSRLA